jgi:hypothetical protein
VKPVDILGKRYGRLLVTRRVPKPSHVKKPVAYWECQCDCGRTTIVASEVLRRGSTKSCGCLRSGAEDLTGRTFGYLTVTESGDAWESKTGHKHGRFRWLCRCGNAGQSTAASLIAGRAKSCGCLKKNPLAAFNNVLYDYKYAAKDRGYSFSLTDAQFRTLTQSDCYYCGAAPDMEERTPSALFVHNGIDRLSNSIGYEHSNCVPCCSTCNRAKLEMSYSAFIGWINRVHSHLARPLAA